MAQPTKTGKIIKRKRQETFKLTGGANNILSQEGVTFIDECCLATQTNQEFIERNRVSHSPKLRLSWFGEKASLDQANECRIPLMLTDIQNLIMTALIGSATPFTPNRWCTIEKPAKISHTVVLVIQGITLPQYLCYESLFVKTKQILNLRFDLLRPVFQEYNLLYDLAQVPLTNSQRKELTERFGSLEIACEINKDHTLMTSAIFCVADSYDYYENNITIANCNRNIVSRTKLLLSAVQMVNEGIPLPLHGEFTIRYHDYVLTKDVYRPVSDQSPMFSVDCEMCRTSCGISELTRISIVNENLETVYESLVLPLNPIIDYLTEYSGITPEMMYNVTKTIEDVQNDIIEMLPPDAILVGHSISADLNAMKMMHPYIIDTSVIYNMSGNRNHKTKLSTLSRVYLNEMIQTNLKGHDSVEDSIACMKLVQLKLNNGIEYGDSALRIGKLVERNSDKFVLNMVAHMYNNTSIVSSKPIDNSFKSILTASNERSCERFNNCISFIETANNFDAVKKTQETIQDHKLTITDLHLNNEQLHFTQVEKTLRDVDKFIADIWKLLSHNGLLLVLLAGTDDIPNGAALLNIKRDILKK